MALPSKLRTTSKIKVTYTMKMTSQKEDVIKNKDDQKNEDDFKNWPSPQIFVPSSLKKLPEFLGARAPIGIARVSHWSKSFRIARTCFLYNLVSNLVQSSLKSHTTLMKISNKSHVNLMQISYKSHAYLGQISGKSQANLS